MGWRGHKDASVHNFRISVYESALSALLRKLRLVVSAEVLCPGTARDVGAGLGGLGLHALVLGDPRP
jgi:hypothetical protein